MSSRNLDNQGTEIGAYSSASRRSKKQDSEVKDLMITELKREIMQLRENQDDIDRMSQILKDLETRCNLYEQERVRFLSPPL